MAATPAAPTTAQVITIQGAGYTMAVVTKAEPDGRPDLVVRVVAAAAQYRLSDGSLVRTHHSPSTGQDFGAALSGVPDVDGDGVDDVVIGASIEPGEGGQAFAGNAYVFSGATGALLYTLRPPQEYFAGHFGIRVAGIPDIDGDGRGDIMVGDGRPSVFVFSGATGALLHTYPYPDPLIGNPDSLSAVPDVDGDGVPDFAVGSYSGACGGDVNNQGRVDLFSGATFARIRQFCSATPVANTWFGFSTVGLPDIDGDGRGDLLIGARYDHSEGTTISTGRAYIVSGLTGAVLHRIESPMQSDYWFGYVVAALPDLDGDGVADVAVGAPWHTLPGYPPGSGAVYAFSGATGALMRTLASPTPEGDNFGHQGAFGNYLIGAADQVALRRGVLAVGAPGERKTHLFVLCRADIDADGQITPADVARFVRIWFQSITTGNLLGDFNGDGAVTPADVSAFVTTWFTTLANSGC